jgi:mRNA-degrading endonuclease toxin of MazEF toxin-antitoxin module
MDNNYKSNKENLIVKIGEIFWCYLGVNIGSEQNGSGPNKTRPVLVLYKFSETFFLIAPLTSKNHTGNWYVKISFNNSSVVLNQIRPVDIKRLGISVSCINDLELDNVVNKYTDLIKRKKHQ